MKCTHLFTTNNILIIGENQQISIEETLEEIPQDDEVAVSQEGTNRNCVSQKEEQGTSLEKNW